MGEILDALDCRLGGYSSRDEKGLQGKNNCRGNKDNRHICAWSSSMLIELFMVESGPERS